MGTCTPKTSINHQSNYENRSNENRTSSNRTGGTRSGSIGTYESEFRKNTSNRKGNVKQNNEGNQFQFTQNSPTNEPTTEIVKQKIGIGILGTHNSKLISVISEHQNIRKTM